MKTFKKLVTSLILSSSVSVAARTVLVELPQEIDNANEVTQIVKDINGAGSWDTVKIGITSFGGDVMQGLRIVNAISTSKARIECNVVGFAASMAAVIATACPHITVANGSTVMFHHAFTIGPDGKKSFELDRVGKALTSVGDTLTRSVLPPDLFDKVDKEKEDVFITKEQFLNFMCKYRHVCK
jgi:ATP-dependent protease ClpP protease subunit